MPRSIALAALVVVLAMASPGSSQSAGINCRKAVQITERTICGSFALRRQDAIMSTKYAALLRLVGHFAQRDQVIADQRFWITNRSICEADKVCIRGAYQGRIRTLGDYIVEAKGKAPLSVGQ
jgi:uncharacterized protein